MIWAPILGGRAWWQGKTSSACRPAQVTYPGETHSGFPMSRLWYGCTS